MSLQVIEGTWEEIERRKAELIGHCLRVTVRPQRPSLPPKKPVIAKKTVTASAKFTERPSALGKYAFVAGSSEDFALEKQAETEREDLCQPTNATVRKVCGTCPNEEANP